MEGSSRAEVPTSSGFVIGIKINSAEFQFGGFDCNDATYIADALDVLSTSFQDV